MMAGIFRGMVASVTSVSGAREALALVAAERNRCNLVVTDHNMPETSGLGLVEAMPKLGVRSNVIVVSAGPPAGSRGAYRCLGVTEFVEMPVKRLPVLAATSRLCRMGR